MICDDPHRLRLNFPPETFVRNWIDRAQVAHAVLAPPPAAWHLPAARGQVMPSPTISEMPPRYAGHSREREFTGKKFRRRHSTCAVSRGAEQEGKSPGGFSAVITLNRERASGSGRDSRASQAGAARPAQHVIS
jgi:hypothetical protein